MTRAKSILRRLTLHIITTARNAIRDADAFTSWTDGDNWFVWERTGFERTSRAASNFHEEIMEIDNRVDAGLISQMGSEGVVWLSENPLAEAPFITPSTDPNNPRTGDDYRYVGGRENRDAQLRFQLNHNLLQLYDCGCHAKLYRWTPRKHH